MIRTEKLCCGYGSRMVLQNVSLSMEAGELWCVLGANGVGKSTLFKKAETVPSGMVLRLPSW